LKITLTTTLVLDNDAKFDRDRTRKNKQFKYSTQKLTQGRLPITNIIIQRFQLQT